MTQMAMSAAVLLPALIARYDVLSLIDGVTFSFKTRRLDLTATAGSLVSLGPWPSWALQGRTEGVNRAHGGS